jgi:hypothetical protein
MPPIVSCGCVTMRMANSTQATDTAAWLVVRTISRRMKTCQAASPPASAIAVGSQSWPSVS